MGLQYGLMSGKLEDEGEFRERGFFFGREVVVYYMGSEVPDGEQLVARLGEQMPAGARICVEREEKSREGTDYQVRVLFLHTVYWTNMKRRMFIDGDAVSGIRWERVSG